MKFSSAAACAIAALLALTAQAPPAPAGPPPITVTYCAFNTWTLAPVGADGQLLVQFSVPGSVAVDDIRFRILWGDETFTQVDDAGKFAAGSSVRHTLSFAHYGEITGETMRSLDLAIEHIHLTNGSTWDPPPTGPYRPVAKCVIYFGLGGRAT